MRSDCGRVFWGCLARTLAAAGIEEQWGCAVWLDVVLSDCWWLQECKRFAKRDKMTMAEEGQWCHEGAEEVKKKNTANRIQVESLEPEVASLLVSLCLASFFCSTFLCYLGQHNIISLLLFLSLFLFLSSSLLFILNSCHTSLRSSSRQDVGILMLLQVMLVSFNVDGRVESVNVLISTTLYTVTY